MSIALHAGYSPCNVTNSFCGRMPALKPSCCASAGKTTFVMTHLWATDPRDGPEEKWTLKTLWDGDQNRGTCDPSRHVEDVQTPLEQAGYDDVLNAMNLRWSRAGGNNPGMWADEWNSHGACMSSLRPSCYASEKDKDRGVVDFFATVMALSDSRPTYDWLFNDGISPTWNYQFGLVQFTRPLENGHGAPVTAQCDRWGVLKSVQYFFELDGCFPYGRFRPVAPASGWHEGCGESVGITYRPKTNPPRNAEELKEWERTRHKPSKKNKAFTIILHKRDMTEPMTTIAPTLMPSERDTLLA